MIPEEYDFSAMLHENLDEDYLEHSWNAFSGRQLQSPNVLGFSYGYRPDRVRLNIGNERSIMAGVLNRIAVDVSSLKYLHARVDQNGSFQERLDSSLDRCLNIQANIDQSGRAFILDACTSLMDEGVIAIVPTEADRDVDTHGAFEIYSMRVGKIIEWYPRHVKVLVYDDYDGEKKEIVLKKQSVAIIENPLYLVMNEPNSTLQRLIRKLNNLDVIDNQMSSGKLDLIVQQPFQTTNRVNTDKAKRFRENVEEQAASSKYGIIYMNGTEKITQLNRGVDNTIQKEVEYLTTLFYSQLGVTDAIMNGTADEATMINYNNRTVNPIATAIVEGMTRAFISKTAITQGKRVMVLPDPFKLSPLSQLAEIADRFTRNEILSSNEVRAIIGREPSNDPRADELVNKNIRQPEDENKESSEDKTPKETEERRDSK